MATGGDGNEKLEELLRRCRDNYNVGYAIKQHMLKIDKHTVNKEPITSREDFIDFMLSTFFMNTLDMYPVRKLRCNLDENSDWPVPLVPAEVFCRRRSLLPPDSFRKNIFFTCLNIGTVLDCRVVSIIPHKYHFRVIHKYGLCRILEDLHIMVQMKRNIEELQILKKDLHRGELVRVAVSEVRKMVEYVVVTVDAKSLGIATELPKLGRISDTELPSYVLDPYPSKGFSSYGDYLDSRPEFQMPRLPQTINIIEGFGLDPYGVYSYYPEINKLKCDKEQSKKDESLRILDSAMHEKKEKNYDEALALLDKAIKKCPENDPLLATLYHLKGTIHLEKGTGNQLMYALCIAAAYKFDQNNKEIKRKLSKLLFKAANGYYKIRNHQKSAYLAEAALKVDDNEPALRLLHVLKTKHAKELMKVEETEQLVTEEQEQLVTEETEQLVTEEIEQLVTELKNMNIR